MTVPAPPAALGGDTGTLPAPVPVGRAVPVSRRARAAYVTTPCVVVGFVPIESMMIGNCVPVIASNVAKPACPTFTLGRSVSLIVRSSRTAFGVFSTIGAVED